MSDQLSISQLIQNLPQQGTVEWLSIRPEKNKAVKIVDRVKASSDGLDGDHYAGRSGNRSVTLIQSEHLLVIASLLHREEVSPAELRRNIVVSGINLLALKDRRFKIGSAVLEMSGLCHPCSRMEKVLGEGGYNAMRGHGGITASVVIPGTITLKDKVELI